MLEQRDVWIHIAQSFTDPRLQSLQAAMDLEHRVAGHVGEVIYPLHHRIRVVDPLRQRHKEERARAVLSVFAGSVYFAFATTPTIL